MSVDGVLQTLQVIDSSEIAIISGRRGDLGDKSAGRRARYELVHHVLRRGTEAAGENDVALHARASGGVGKRLPGQGIVRILQSGAEGSEVAVALRIGGDQRHARSRLRPVPQLLVI